MVSHAAIHFHAGAPEGLVIPSVAAPRGDGGQRSYRPLDTPSQDPLVPASEHNVRITNIALSLQFTFLRARAELTYLVEAGSTLAPGSWQVIATNPGAVSLTEPVTVTDTIPVSTESRRFLRLRVQ
jgi:hypothetical protein